MTPLPGHSQAGVLLGRDGPGPAVPPAASPPADRREGFELRLVCSVAGISVFRRLLAGLACLASAAIVFLLSEAAAFVSGACLRIDGGAPNARRHWMMSAGQPSPEFDGFHRSRKPRVLGG